AAELRADLKRLKRETETGRAIAASSGTLAVAQESGSPVAQSPLPTSGFSPALAPSPSSSAVKVAEGPVAGRKLWKVLVPAAAILVAAAIGGSVLLPFFALYGPSDRKGHDRSRRFHQHHWRCGVRRHAEDGAERFPAAVAFFECALRQWGCEDLEIDDPPRRHETHARGGP